MVRQPRFGDGAAQGGPPRGRHRGIQHVLVQHVDEAVAPGQRAVRQLLFRHKADQAVRAFDVLEPIFDDGRILPQRRRHNRRVKVGTLDTGGDQEPAIRVVYPLDLPLNQAAHRRRQVALGGGERPGQRPTTIITARDHAAIP